MSQWTRTRLPALGRSFGQKHTRLERGISKAFQYVGRVALLSGAVILSVKALTALQLLSPEILEGSFWIPAALILLLFSHAASRIAACMDHPL
jgi:hypothetical protein